MKKMAKLEVDIHSSEWKTIIILSCLGLIVMILPAIPNFIHKFNILSAHHLIILLMRSRETFMILHVQDCPALMVPIAELNPACMQLPAPLIPFPQFCSSIS